MEKNCSTSPAHTCSIPSRYLFILYETANLTLNPPLHPGGKHFWSVPTCKIPKFTLNGKRPSRCIASISGFFLTGIACCVRVDVQISYIVTTAISTRRSTHSTPTLAARTIWCEQHDVKAWLVSLGWIWDIRGFLLFDAQKNGQLEAGERFCAGGTNAVLLCKPLWLQCIRKRQGKLKLTNPVKIPYKHLYTPVMLHNPLRTCNVFVNN